MMLDAYEFYLASQTKKEREVEHLLTAYPPLVPNEV